MVAPPVPCCRSQSSNRAPDSDRLRPTRTYPNPSPFAESESSANRNSKPITIWIGKQQRLEETEPTTLSPTDTSTSSPNSGPSSSVTATCSQFTASPSSANPTSKPNAQTVPSPFSSGDIVEWLGRYVACADANGWTVEQRVQRIPPYLTGQANILYRRLADGEKDTWAHLRENLIAQFYPIETRTARTIEFQSTRFTPGETIDAYAYRVERKLDQAMPELSVAGAAQARTEMLKSQFINGLLEPYKTRLYENPMPTFQQCQTTARQLMAAAQLSLLLNPLTNSSLLGAFATPSTLSTFQSTTPFSNTQQVKVEPYLPTNASRPYYSDRSEYESRRDRQDNTRDRYYDSRDYNRNNGRDYGERQPRNDDRRFHDYNDNGYRRDSRERRDYQRSPSPNRGRNPENSRYSDYRSSNNRSPDPRREYHRTAASDILCFECGGRGHISNICPNNSRRDRAQREHSKSPPRDQNQAVRSASPGKSGGTKNIRFNPARTSMRLLEYFVDVKVNGIQIRCLVDCGSATSSMQSNFYSFNFLENYRT